MKRRHLVIAAIVVAMAAVFVCWKVFRQPAGSPQGLSRISQNKQSAADLQRFLARTGPLSSFELPLQWPPSSLHPAGPLLSESSLDERKRYSDSLLGGSAGLLLERWISESQVGQDGLKLDFIADALVVRLREEGSGAAAVVARMAEFAGSGENDLFLRWRMVQTLGEAATPEVLQALLELAESGGNGNPLEPIVLQQIAGTGEVQWEGRFHDELTPILEQAWAKTEIGEELAAAVANAMADVGTPALVERLIRESVLAGPDPADFEQRGQSKARQAYQALEQVRNAESVTVLARYLNEGRAGDVSMIAAGQSLASMGRPEATAALLEWSRAASDDVSVFIDEWMARLRDPASVELAASVAANGIFANPSNQKTLQTALALWYAHRER